MPPAVRFLRASTLNGNGTASGDVVSVTGVEKDPADISSINKNTDNSVNGSNDNNVSVCDNGGIWFCASKSC